MSEQNQSTGTVSAHLPDHICEDVVEAFCATYTMLDEKFFASDWDGGPTPKELRRLAATLTLAASVRREDIDRQICDAWSKEAGFHREDDKPPRRE